MRPVVRKATRRMSARDKGRTQGYALACAEVARFDNVFGTLLREMVRSYGLTLEMCREAEVDQFDVDALVNVGVFSDLRREKESC